MFKQTLRALTVLTIAASPLLMVTPAIAQDDAKSNQFWWPEYLDLSPLRQHTVAAAFQRGRGLLLVLGSPLGPGLRYGDREAAGWLREMIASQAWLRCFVSAPQRR